MHEGIAFLLSLLLGAILGTVFFGGLWWTVGKALTSKAPAVWFLGSLIVRMGLTVSGFYAASKGGLVPLVVCLFGFLIARQAVMSLTRSAKGTNQYDAKEATHAP